MTRTVVIHSLDHARAAMAAAAALDVEVWLASAPGAAAYAGAGWFLEVIAIARAVHPDARVTAVLDCGDRPGLVLGALRRGCRAVRFTGRGRALSRIKAIAKRYGAVVYGDLGPLLDLGAEPDPPAACRAWLAIESDEGVALSRTGKARAALRPKAFGRRAAKGTAEGRRGR
jgi:hypothetical protein